MIEEMPPYPTTNDPSTVEECDENLRYWSALSRRLGLPVEGEGGGCAIDEWLELRHKLSLQEADERVEE